MHKNRRRFRLIRPRLQLRLILAFAGVASLALLLQYILVSYVLTDIAVLLPEDGNLLLEASARRMLGVLGLSLIVLLPLTLWVGVLVTHRIAGPLYKIERYMKEALSGRVQQECKLRSGDELLELCDLVNRMTAAMNQRHASSSPSREPQVETELSGSPVGRS